MKTCLLLIFCLSYYLSGAQKITHIEYYIDTDKGYNKNTVFAVVPFSDSSYTISIDLSSVPTGIHQLYLRMRDSSGKWSITTRRSIEVKQPMAANKMLNGEYFFDIDPGYGNATSIAVSPKDTAIVQTFKPNVRQLEPGFHKLYTRFKDSYGNWGLTCRRNVEIITNTDTAKIVGVEYAFDKDPGYGKGTLTLFPKAATDGKFQLQIPYNAVPGSAKILIIRVSNADNLYSFTKLIKVKVNAALLENYSSIMKSKESLANNFSANVFPNPVEDGVAYLQVFTQLAAKVSIAIIDINGKIISVQSKTLPVGSSVQPLNMQSLAPGTYFIRVVCVNRHLTIPVVKE